MPDEITGIILLAFGGADSPEAIEPFMKNLMGGRIPPPALLEKMKARYALIGGKSPLPEITANQAEQLERYLCSKGGEYRVVVGMRYWHPFIEEALEKLSAKGIKKVIALSLAPFFSQVSTGAYIKELERLAAMPQANGITITVAKDMYDNRFFLRAVAQKVTEGLSRFSVERRKGVQVIFSAHSLPVTSMEKGDPYVQQFEFAVDRVVALNNLKNWCIAYQSKGGGQGDWLGPTVEEVMSDFKNQGHTDILVVPMGFVSDHIETLYDIDIAQKNHADTLGLNFHRTASLNTSPLFIQALAELALGKSL